MLSIYYTRTSYEKNCCAVKLKNHFLLEGNKTYADLVIYKNR